MRAGTRKRRTRSSMAKNTWPAAKLIRACEDIVAMQAKAPGEWDKLWDNILGGVVRRATSPGKDGVWKVYADGLGTTCGASLGGLLDIYCGVSADCTNRGKNRKSDMAIGALFALPKSCNIGELDYRDKHSPGVLLAGDLFCIGGPEHVGLSLSNSRLESGSRILTFDGGDKDTSGRQTMCLHVREVGRDKDGMITLSRYGKARPLTWRLSNDKDAPLPGTDQKKASLGATVFGPNEDADQRYLAVKKGWNELLKKGEKFPPQILIHYVEWQKFEKKWDEGESGWGKIKSYASAGLSRKDLASGLTMVESELNSSTREMLDIEKAKKVPVKEQTKIFVPTGNLDVASSSGATIISDKTDKTVKKVETKVSETVDAVTDTVKGAVKSAMPSYTTMALAALAVVVVVAGVAKAESELMP
jgi:hypothetical protein